MRRTNAGRLVHKVMVPLLLDKFRE